MISKWNSCNCTSDILQNIQLLIHDSDGIDWSTFWFSAETFGGCINSTWWHSSPFADSLTTAELVWATQQDYSVTIDTISDTMGIVTITPLGRGDRPFFVCGDSCAYVPYGVSCCLNVGDINSPGFGQTPAPYWSSPTHIQFIIRDLVGEHAPVWGYYFCVDYSGPTASHPKPTPNSYVDTSNPIISIVILDTITVRHSAYPDPIDPYFPHCPCFDSACVDSLGELLEFPYCGFNIIEWNTIDTASITLSVNGFIYKLGRPGMHWIDDSLLLLNTGEADLAFADGETVRVCLEEATDRVMQGYGPNHLGRHADWTHPDTPVPFCWEFYINITGIEEASRPKKSGIDAIVPNPFNSKVTIKYTVADDCPVEISVFDILGRKVGALLKEKKGVGSYEEIWDAGDIHNGIYFIRAIIGDNEITKRVVYLK